MGSWRPLGRGSALRRTSAVGSVKSFCLLEPRLLFTHGPIAADRGGTGRADIVENDCVVSLDNKFETRCFGVDAGIPNLRTLDVDSRIQLQDPIRRRITANNHTISYHVSHLIIIFVPPKKHVRPHFLFRGELPLSISTAPSFPLLKATSNAVLPSPSCNLTLAP